MQSVNNCPLASSCPSWARYQRDKLLPELVREAGSYRLALVCLELSADGRQGLPGMEHAFLIAVELHKLDASLPRTKQAMSKYLKKASSPPCRATR